MVKKGGGTKMGVRFLGTYFLKFCLWIKYTAAAAAAKSLQSCPTLSDPMDYNLPGSSVRGIFQARVLEWGAIAFSETSMLIYFK